MVVHTPRFDCFSIFESLNTGTRKFHIEELNATRFERLLRDLAVTGFMLASGHQYFFSLLVYDKISLDYPDAEPCRRVDGVSGGWCCPWFATRRPTHPELNKLATRTTA
jgi:hypothetical protein